MPVKRETDRCETRVERPSIWRLASLAAWSFASLAAWSLASLGALLMLGCNDLQRFDTTDGSAYCGNIVGASFVRQGFSHRPRMELELDIDQLGSMPGSITTDDAADGPCSPEPTFASAQLRSSPKLQADPLSVLEFGEERERNLISWVDSTCDGTYLAVVSLLRDDGVELRLMRSEPDELGLEQGPFGVFQLKRFDETCGFD